MNYDFSYYHGLILLLFFIYLEGRIMHILLRLVLLLLV